MSYSMQKQRKTSKYVLHEKESGSQIELNISDKQEARAICRKLNLGSGFKGYTPNFFVKSMFTSVAK